MERFEDPERIAEQQRRAADDFHRTLRDSETATEANAEAALEEQRLDETAGRLRQVDGLQPEQWQKMDIYERKAVLNQAGQVLEDTYDSPRPPLLVKDMGEPNALGSYGDGYRFNDSTGRVEGADYRIAMNEAGQASDGTLFGDDPRQALRTYAHEFRHSYQAEQATRFEKPQFRNLVDVPGEAQGWSENNRHYVRPEQGFDAYRSQPVEQDARDFADKLVDRVYR